MIDHTRCACGMNLFPEEGSPVPYGLKWRIAHRDQHLAMFPDCDQTTRDNLDLLVADARIRNEGLATA